MATKSGGLVGEALRFHAADGTGGLRGLRFRSARPWLQAVRSSMIGIFLPLRVLAAPLPTTEPRRTSPAMVRTTAL